MARKTAFLTIGMLCVLVLGGCSAISNLNTIRKDKIITTGIFGGNIKKITDAIEWVRNGIGIMTKPEVAQTGFDFNNDNVHCLKGAPAMQYFTGVVNNTIDLSTEEKIDAYAKTVSVREACIFKEHKIQSNKPRLWWSSGKEKTTGPEVTFIILFKNNILFDAFIASKQHRNELEIDKTIGGNVLDNVVGAAISGARRFGR